MSIPVLPALYGVGYLYGVAALAPGAIAGLALLSKYLVRLWPVAMLLGMMATPHHRRFLRLGHTWWAVGLALLVIVGGLIVD